MKLKIVRVVSVCAVGFSTFACSGSKGDGNTDIGAEAVVALSVVPEGVGCLRVTVAGKSSTQSNFDVVAGQSTQLRMSGLPIGDASFVGEAFDASCVKVGAGATPSWVGEPVMAKLQSGQTALVQLALRQNGRALVGVDFKIDPATGEPCVGPTPGCLDPSDAFATSGGLLPDGARLVGTAEFGRGLSDGSFKLTSTRLESASDKADDESAERARELVKGALQARPDLAYLAEPVIPDEATRPAAGGNFEIDVADALGNRQSIVTMGDKWALRELAGSVTRYPSQANQAGIYQTFFSNLPEDFRKRNQLPDPREVANLPAAELVRLNQSLVERLEDITLIVPPEGFPPAGYPKSCADEEMTPSPATDQTGASCSPNGLWKAAPVFPLRWRATCVKNQASRGTCVSFGITGAAEAAIAVKHNRWLNLSEQKLYYTYKAPTAWGDGLDTAGVMSDLVSTARTYSFEPRWDYNPSSSRINVPALPPSPAPPLPGTHYEQSCTGYGGEHCSNTAHQGDLVCTTILNIFTFCAWNGDAPADAGFRLTNTMNFWSVWGPAGASAWARLGLILKTPMVMSFAVVPSFDNAPSSGIVTYVGPGEKSRGGHAVAVMGFIDNANLPAGTPAGAGGGYFIVKNSWGKCWKDGGYVYLPYAWVETYAYQMSSLQVN